MNLLEIVKDLKGEELQIIEISLPMFVEGRNELYLNFSNGKVIRLQWPSGHDLEEDDIWYSDGTGWK